MITKINYYFTNNASIRHMLNMKLFVETTRKQEFQASKMKKKKLRKKVVHHEYVKNLSASLCYLQRAKKKTSWVDFMSEEIVARAMVIWWWRSFQWIFLHVKFLLLHIHLHFFCECKKFFSCFYNQKLFKSPLWNLKEVNNSRKVKSS